MRVWIGGMIGAALLASASAATAACQIKVFGDLPLLPSDNRALVSGAVNAKPAVFIADTGADASSMPLPDAQGLGLRLSGMNDIRMEGAGGQAKTGWAHFDLKLGSANLPGEVMLVLGMGHLDHHAVALVGRELLMQHDLELNLPDHDIKLVQAQGCTPDQLVYWNKPYSMTRLEGDGSPTPAIRINVLLNGHVTRALLDSGAMRSIVTPDAARAAGANLESGTKAGMIAGIGAHRSEAEVVQFDSFTVGEETIKNAKLIVADIWAHNRLEETGTRLGSRQHEVDEPRMLLGADFLRSHRVLVANSLGVMVFSYMGGPVFDISQPRPAEAPTTAATNTPASPAAPATPAGPKATDTTQR